MMVLPLDPKEMEEQTAVVLLEVLHILETCQVEGYSVLEKDMEHFETILYLPATAMLEAAAATDFQQEMLHILVDLDNRVL